MLVLRAEQLEHRQRYRVSMSSNHSDRQRILHEQNVYTKKVNQDIQICAVRDKACGGLSAPFFPKSHKNKEIQLYVHLTFYIKNPKYD